MQLNRKPSIPGSPNVENRSSRNLQGKAAQNCYCEPATVDCELSKGHCLTSRARTRNASAPSAISANPHFRVEPVCQKSHAQPIIVSTAGSGYSHILNGKPCVPRRRRSSITPTAWPMNCTSSRIAKIPAIACFSLSETLNKTASPARTTSETCGKCFVGCTRPNTGKKFPSRGRIGDSRSAEQNGECRCHRNPQNHSRREARRCLPVQSFDKQAGNEIGILRLAPRHHAQDARLHRQIQDGDPQHGEKNSPRNIPLGILDLAAELTNVVVPPVAVDCAHHRGPQPCKPHP